MATRRVPFDPADAADIRPEQRQREVAAFLIAGERRFDEFSCAPCDIARLA